MHQWNKGQPNRQGSLAHFNTYFNSLFNNDKEVHLYYTINEHTIQSYYYIYSLSKKKCVLYGVWWYMLMYYAKDPTTNIIFRGKQRQWCPNKTLHQVTRGVHTLQSSQHTHNIPLCPHLSIGNVIPLSPCTWNSTPSFCLTTMLCIASQFFLDLSTPILQLYANPNSLHCPHALLCLHTPCPHLCCLINMLSWYLFLSHALQYLSGCLYGLYQKKLIDIASHQGFQ